MKEILHSKPRALVYCRVSSAGQEEKGTSLESQAAECTAYAKANGYHIAETVKEVFSGAYLFDRPKLNACRDRLRAGAYDAIIVYAIDRLSRDVAHLAIIADEVERAGAKLIFVTEDLDNTAEGKLMLSVKSYVAEIERLKIRERTLRGRKTKLENGKLSGTPNPLYGYTVDQETGSRQIVESEAVIIRRIFEEYSTGKSLRSIALDLNSEGVPTAKQTQWASGVIHNLLKRREYLGETYALKYATEDRIVNGKRKRIVNRKAATEWMQLPNSLTPQIVDTNTFAIVQRRFYFNAGDRVRNLSRPSLLRGLVFCGKCGKKMFPVWAKPNRDNPSYIYYSYRCNTKAGGMLDRCVNQTNGNKIEAAVWNQITAILTNSDSLKLGISKKRNADTKKELKNELARAKSDFRKTASEIDRLIKRMASVDDTLFGSINKEINRKAKMQSRLEIVVAETQTKLDSLREEVSFIETLEANRTIFRDRLPQLDFHRKRLICETFVAKINLLKPNYTVSMSIPMDSETLNGISNIVSDDKS